MKSCVFAILGCLAGSLAAAEPPPAPRFQAGAATSTITPPLGGGIIGGFVPFPATHVHDELHARCLVLDDGQTRLALVVCDLLGIHRSLSVEARKLIQQTAGLPPERVLICATHTHSACSALGENRLKTDQPLDDYQRFVAQRIADGVKCAVNNLRPAEIAFATAQAPEHVNNRRWFLKPGTMPPNPFGGIDQAKMNPSAGSPDLVEPAGPTDPEDLAAGRSANRAAGRSRSSAPTRCTTSAAWVRATSRPTTTGSTAGSWSGCCRPGTRIRRSSP